MAVEGKLVPLADAQDEEFKKKNISFRLTLDLSKSKKSCYPEFSYQQLYSKLLKENNKDNVSLIGDEDSGDLKALAKRFEEKYGSGSSYASKKSKTIVNEFVDIGYGYDESDNFIDNSEAYDEVVPCDWTTEHGGFYINQGNLDFRPMERDLLTSSMSIVSKKKKKKKIDKEKVLKTPKEISTYKKKKHLLNKEKQRKRQESLLKAQKILVKKKKKVSILDDSSQDAIPLSQLNKSSEDDMPLSVIAKTSSESNEQIINNDENIPLAKFTGSPKVSVTDCLIESKFSTISELNNHTSSQHGTPVVQSTENAKVTTPKVFVELPDNLSEDLLQDIKELKKFSEISVKGKFFNAEVNKVLLSFARKCRQQSPKLRNVIYEHILYYLPCAKDTLVKRCRALVVQHQKDLEDQPMKLLQEAIDASMPSQKNAYDEEVAKALQEQAREQIKQTGVDPSKQNDQNQNSVIADDKKRAIPKRKYSWTDEIRKLLCDVIQVRVGLYKMSKSRSMTAEEYIKDFLESEIRVTWPKGWMTSRILYKESRIAHQEITQPLNKGKKVLKTLQSTKENTNNLKTDVTSKNQLNSQSIVVTSPLTQLKPLHTSQMTSQHTVVSSTKLQSNPLVKTHAQKKSVWPMAGQSAIVLNTSVVKSSIVSNHVTQVGDSKNIMNPVVRVTSIKHPTTNASLKPQFVGVRASQNTSITLQKTPQNSITCSAPLTPVTTVYATFDGSPKVSPLLTTPTIIRGISSVTQPQLPKNLARQSNEQRNNKQVKRKTPEDIIQDELLRKKSVTILDYCSPSTSHDTSSWPQFENDLARISREATSNRMNNMNSKQCADHISSSQFNNENYDILSRKYNQTTTCNVTHLSGIQGTVLSSMKTSPIKTSAIVKDTKLPSYPSKPLPRTITSIHSKNAGRQAPKTSVNRVTMPHQIPHQHPAHQTLQHLAASHSVRFSTNSQHLAMSQQQQAKDRGTLSKNASLTKNMSLNRQVLQQSTYTPSVTQTSPLNSVLANNPMRFPVPQHPAMRLLKSSEASQLSQMYNMSEKNADHCGNVHSHSVIHNSHHPSMKLANELNRTSIAAARLPNPTPPYSQAASNYATVKLGSTPIRYLTHNSLIQQQSPGFQLSGEPQRRLSVEQQQRMQQLQNEVMNSMKTEGEYRKNFSNFGSSYS